MVSDLAKKRRVVVDAARSKPVLIRDTDGVGLILQTAAAAEAKDELLRLHVLRAVAEVECRRDAPNRTAMAELGFLADWPDRDARQTFLDDLATVLADPEYADDPSAAEFFIRHASPAPGPTPVPTDDAAIRRLGAALETRPAR